MPGLGRGLRRVRVALHQHRRRALPRELLAELLDDPGHLDVPRLRADPGQGLRYRQPGGGKEHAGQFIIGVLAAVYEHGLRAENADDRRQFNNFGTSPDHYCYLGICIFFQHKTPLVGGCGIGNY